MYYVTNDSTLSYVVSKIDIINQLKKHSMECNAYIQGWEMQIEEGTQSLKCWKIKEQEQANKIKQDKLFIGSYISIVLYLILMSCYLD